MSLLRALARWLGFAGLLALGRRRAGAEQKEERERFLPLQPPDDPAERLVLSLLALVVLASVGFIVVYALDANTQLLGLTLGLALAFAAAAAVVASRRLVPQEEYVEDRGELAHPVDEQEAAQLLGEGGDRISRRGLLLTAAGVAGTALGAALVVPSASLGPFLETDEFYGTPWRRGRRLVDEGGKPLAADDVREGAFLTAFPEGAPRSELGSSLVVIRLRPQELALPSGRSGWAPDGVLAFSKICPHAACAISLYRHPLFEPGAPGPALVCPCHYSTFDPTRGGELVFGPAGRALPQLPVAIDDEGNLRAAGGFSGPIGPSWWGVRL